MPAELDNSLIAASSDEWGLVIDGVPAPLPPWSHWLIWLGQWMRLQAALEGRRIAVVRLPSRRLGAAFAVIGSVLGSARLHNGSLDWEGLCSLTPGAKVFWRETTAGRTVRRSGAVKGVREFQGAEFMEVLVEQQGRKGQAGTRLFAKTAALSYGITLGSVSAAADERLNSAERVIAAAVPDGGNGWIRSPGIECSVVTELSSFMEDLSGLSIRVGSHVEAPCIDLLAMAEAGGRTHGKTTLVSTRADELLDRTPVMVLDGPPAALRLTDTFARSTVILVDQAEYDDEIEQLVQNFAGYAIDSPVHPPAGGVKAPPPSIEPFIFGLPA